MTAGSYLETREFIIAYLRELNGSGAGNGPIEMNTNIVELGLIDSFGFLNLISTIEQRYGIEVDLSAEEPDFFLSIDGLSRIIEKLRSQAADR